ncbi:MAG: PTS fructose transporter subunit IIA [Candidatus Marinimicrobia bacterium CG08_land_8_20_14_0_20_45_22]|nr:MAG: PTS fructose transporter subunit IIA [Candidatus Marinimicrobia bacterium CG08_land_8_20_14_0_20_45_22]
MEISRVLTPNLIIYPLEATSKEEVISALVDRLYDEGKITDPDSAKKAVIDRENLMSTGVGRGIALPHGKYSESDDVFISVGISPEGIDFAAIDNKPVHIFVLLLTPERFPRKHLEPLSRFSRLLNSTKCREDLMNAKTPEEIAQIFSCYDAAV